MEYREWCEHWGRDPKSPLTRRQWMASDGEGMPVVEVGPVKDTGWTGVPFGCFSAAETLEAVSKARTCTAYTVKERQNVYVGGEPATFARVVSDDGESHPTCARGHDAGEVTLLASWFLFVDLMNAKLERDQEG